MARTKLRRLGDEDAIIVVLTDPYFGEALRKGLDEVQTGGAGGRKIPDIRIVRPLPEGHIVHELRNDPIEIHIALAMGVRGEIDGDAINPRGEIGTMIQIKTAQEILIGFPTTTVL